MPGMPRKAKHVSIPDPMTSVVQEINGVKRKVTTRPVVISTPITHPKIVPTPQLRELHASMQENALNNNLTKDLIPIKKYDQTNSKNENFASSNSILGLTTASKLALDPMELHSITKLQNWTPPIRKPAKDIRAAEARVQHTFMSQKDLNNSHSDLMKNNLTQLTPGQWKPPLRRHIIATDSSAIPMKKAKIGKKEEQIALGGLGNGCEREAEDTEDNLQCCQTKNQMQEPTKSHDVVVLQKSNSQILPTEGNKIQTQDIGYIDQKERSQPSKESDEISNYSGGKYNLNDDLISYSPTEFNNNEIQNEDPLAENFPTESKFHTDTQNAMDDILPGTDKNFDEVTNNDLSEIQSKDPLSKVYLAEVSKIKMDSKNSVEDIFLQKDEYDSDHKEVDLFGSEGRNDSPLRESKVNNDSQHSMEDIFQEKDNGATEKDMFGSEEDNIPILDLETGNRESQQPKASLTPSSDGFHANEVLSRNALTPPRNSVIVTPQRTPELDISSCPTVKRVCAVKLLPTLPILEELSEVSSALDTVVNSHLELEESFQSGTTSNEVHAFDSVYVAEVSTIAANSTGSDKFTPNKEHTDLKNGKFPEEIVPAVVDQDDQDQDEAGLKDDDHITRTVQEVMPLVFTKALDKDQEDWSESADVPEPNLMNNLSQSTAFVEKERNAENIPNTEENLTNLEKDALRFKVCMVNRDDEIEHNVGEKNNEIPTKLENSSIVEKSEEEIKLKEITCNLSQIKAVSELMSQIKDHEINSAAEAKIPQADENAQTIHKEPSTKTAVALEQNGDTSQDRMKMKPYNYEMDQDFDISQTQLIEIESAFLQERRQLPVIRTNAASFKGAVPRVGEVPPGQATTVCGEAKVPSFTMPRPPTMPTINWKEKIQEDRQKLRAAIHEISRLNAMLMTVRREVWPLNGTNSEAPSSSDTLQPGHVPSTRRY